MTYALLYIDKKTGQPVYGSTLNDPPIDSMKKCKCGADGEPMHSCPYQQDINGDDSIHCDCCVDCQNTCADDI